MRPHADAAIDAFQGWLEAERAYLEARFFALHADAIAEAGLDPDDFAAEYGVTDLAEAQADLAARCAPAVAEAYEQGTAPGFEELRDPETDPDGLTARRPLLMVQHAEAPDGERLALAFAGGFAVGELDRFDTLWLARPTPDGWRIVGGHRLGALPEAGPLIGGDWRHACGEPTPPVTPQRTIRVRPPAAAAERAAFFAEPDPAHDPADSARIERQVLEIARGEPGSAAWGRARALMLHHRPGGCDWREAALDALDRWPDEALEHRGCDPTHPAWPLARAVRLDAGALDETALDALAALPRLRTLTVADAGPADLDRILRLPGLRRLRLVGSPTLGDLSPLARHPTLSALRLEWCVGLDLTPGWVPPNIRDLELRNLDMTDLTPLSGAGHLRALAITMQSFGPERALARIGPVDGLDSLEALDLGYSGLSDLDGVERLTGLRSLTLTETGITSLGGLETLAALEELKLAGCHRLTDLAPVAALSKLRLLNLSGRAAIADLSPVAGSTTLRWLGLSGQKLESLTPLETLTGLETLAIVSCPRLTTADVLRPLRGLRRVILSSCENLSDISALDDLPALAHVFVTDCPQVDRIERGARWDPA